MCVSVSPACVSVYHMYNWCRRRLKRTLGPLGHWVLWDIVSDGCELPYQCWKANPGPLQEEQWLLPPEPSLQPLWVLALVVSDFTAWAGGAVTPCRRAAHTELTFVRLADLASVSIAGFASMDDILSLCPCDAYHRVWEHTHNSQ